VDARTARRILSTPAACARTPSTLPRSSSGSATPGQWREASALPSMSQRHMLPRQPTQGQLGQGEGGNTTGGNNNDNDGGDNDGGCAATTKIKNAPYMPLFLHLTSCHGSHTKTC
jgi:hypothetical protein